MSDVPSRKNHHITRHNNQITKKAIKIIFVFRPLYYHLFQLFTHIIIIMTCPFGDEFMYVLRKGVWKTATTDKQKKYMRNFISFFTLFIAVSLFAFSTNIFPSLTRSLMHSLTHSQHIISQKCHEGQWRAPSYDYVWVSGTAASTRPA